MFKQSKWIWLNKEEENDEYGEFYGEFNSSGNCNVNISCDGNYELYVNGTLAAWNQYADFEDYKIYDSVDITPFCRDGLNKLGIIVWHIGKNGFSTYKSAAAGLLFEVESCGKPVLSSGKDILSRLCRTYLSHKEKIITIQLGYSYEFDACAGDRWLEGDLVGFAPSRIVKKTHNLYPRPVDKLILDPLVSGTIIRNEGNYILFDLGREYAGALELHLKSGAAQTILVTFGEHIADGRVRSEVGGRDFSLIYHACAGENNFLGTMRRLGCRYIELFIEVKTEIRDVGIRPMTYPVTRKPFSAENDMQKQIHDICVHTLECCMHEHYEDCPWREQAMYVLDSRNQMLCGYYAFGEYRFARASLILMAKSLREDGLLELTAPADPLIPIPFFSLVFPQAVSEYVRYSNDRSILPEVKHAIFTILETCVSKITDKGLLPRFPYPFWNFYEWAKFGSYWMSEGNEKECLGTYDLVLNSALILALQYQSELYGKDNSRIIDSLRKNARQTFYDADGLLFVNNHDRAYSQLSMSLAILAKIADAGACDAVMNDKRLVGATLSTKAFVYDALLAEKAEGSREYILNDIYQNYENMVKSGASTVWETELGEKDFGGAGSLCHGWSAIPIYYFNILK